MNLRPQALLDGEIVTAETIDPKIHRYIGTFRPADWAGANHKCWLWQIGNTMPHQSYNDMRSCWEQGGCDIPQYLTIRDTGK